MFLEFYHLRQQPFGVTPDPAYLYLTHTHQDALTSLVSGIKEGRGFFALIAEPGMGKTTLLYELLDQLHDCARTVFLFQTQCDAREFFQYLLSELGVDTKGLDLVTMHNKLNELLFGELVAGRRFVLVVDEAQNLSDAVLETVRLLSNFETSYAKMLQIVLAGQPQLSGKLAQPQLAQLKQRLAVLARLEPLSVAETGNYIEHRLKVAGYVGEPLFTTEALTLVGQLSGGTPRMINHLCYSALTAGHAQLREVIDAEIVRGAAAKLGLADEPGAWQVRSERGAKKPAAKETAAAASAGAAATSSPAVMPAQPVAETTAAPEMSREGAPAAAGALTYDGTKRPRLPKWAFRALIVAAILVLAGVFLTAFMLRLNEPGRATRGAAAAHPDASPAAADASPPSVDSSASQMNHASGSEPSGNSADANGAPSSSYSADPQENGSVQVITVSVKPDQTLRDLSVLYAGRYDNDMLKQILALNPELKDPDHLEPGQLIRLPLPAGSFKKGKLFTPEE